jgi:hypothetical protein
MCILSLLVEKEVGHYDKIEFSLTIIDVYRPETKESIAIFFTNLIIMNSAKYHSYV